MALHRICVKRVKRKKRYNHHHEYGAPDFPRRHRLDIGGTWRKNSFKGDLAIMNYSYPLKFGTFITPLSKVPETVVALARRSEELGYDLVTFQDHPYQPAFLDT